MKGIVFTEFLEMVEEKFGIETADSIITNSNLKSEGIYTAVGTYDFKEMLSLVTNLHKETNIDVDTLVHAYGVYFFNTVKKGYHDILDYYKGAFDMIAGIEKHIHVHVRKIYPDAELPYFITHEESDDKLVLEYHSERAMSSFALGLMESTLDHYKEKATIKREFLEEDGTKVLFTLTRNA